MEYCSLVRIKLQSLRAMESAEADGCQLCSLLLTSVRQKIPSGEYSCLDRDMLISLGRSFGAPERAIDIFCGVESEEVYVQCAFFYRMPGEWCKLLTRP
jgi:hypothetical protein